MLGEHLTDPGDKEHGDVDDLGSFYPEHMRTRDRRVLPKAKTYTIRTGEEGGRNERV